LSVVAAGATFTIGAVTEGQDAVGEVSVVLEVVASPAPVRAF